MVTSPAVPPYSSTTIAMWNFSVCISRRSSATRFDSGTKCADRRLSRTGSAPWPDELRATRSFRKTRPAMLSVVSS